MTSLAFLPNLVGPDGLVIFLFILLFFGAKRLPELAKGLGSAVREFSKAKDEIEHEITRAPTPRIEEPKPVDSQHLAAAPVPSAETIPVAPAPMGAVPMTAPVVAPTPVAAPAPLSAASVTEESHQASSHQAV